MLKVFFQRVPLDVVLYDGNSHVVAYSFMQKYKNPPFQRLKFQFIRTFVFKIRTVMKQFDWAEDIEGAVTVCDAEGKVVYMNKRSRETFNKDGQTMVGKSLYPCHNERSQEIIRDMLENDRPHCYTISKHGQRKLIYQTPWRENGEVKGLVEFSFVIPEEMPHYDRG